jgi:transcription elongation factor Elf1
MKIVQTEWQAEIKYKLKDFDCPYCKKKSISSHMAGLIKSGKNFSGSMICVYCDNVFNLIIRDRSNEQNYIN